MNDTSDVTSQTTSWTTMLRLIEEALATEDVNKARIIQILSDYKSKKDDWIRYAFFHDEHYTRNLVDSGNGIYNLMLLAWNPAQGSCIHDHYNSSCFVKVLAGAISEIRYETPGEGEEFATIGNYTRIRDEVAYIDDSIGVHEMKNDTASQSVSLHLYIPPIDVCNAYNRKTAAKSRCSMTFNTVYGEIIEKDPPLSKDVRPCV